MKNVFLSIASVVLGLMTISCSKEAAKEEYYTDAQKEAQRVLKGTFVQDLYGVVTTYNFTEQYDSFKEVECYGFTGSDKSKFIVHGKCTLTYWNGDSYELFYFLNEKADNIGFFSTAIHAKAYDLKIVSDTEFRLHQGKDAFWDTFKKQ